jgi:hypothetical protein
MQTEEGRHFVLLCWRGGRCCAGGGWWLVLQHEWLGSLASTLEHFAHHQWVASQGDISCFLTVVLLEPYNILASV